jgi:hypothetical protein
LDGFLAEKGFCNDVADGGWFVVFVDWAEEDGKDIPNKAFEFAFELVVGEANFLKLSGFGDLFPCETTGYLIDHGLG